MTAATAGQSRLAKQSQFPKLGCQEQEERSKIAAMT